MVSIRKRVTNIFRRKKPTPSPKAKSKVVTKDFGDPTGGSQSTPPEVGGTQTPRPTSPGGGGGGGTKDFGDPTQQSRPPQSTPAPIIPRATIKEFTRGPTQ